MNFKTLSRSLALVAIAGIVTQTLPALTPAEQKQKRIELTNLLEKQKIEDYINAKFLIEKAKIKDLNFGQSLQQSFIVRAGDKPEAIKVNNITDKVLGKFKNLNNAQILNWKDVLDDKVAGRPKHANEAAWLNYFFNNNASEIAEFNGLGNAYYNLMIDYINNLP